MDVNVEQRTRLESQWHLLKAERKTWELDVRDIGDHMAPYLVHDENESKTLTNHGQRRDHEIINNKPLRARATLEAGLQAGMTSPSRPWFSLSVSDKGLRKLPNVRLYLDQVRDIMLEVLAVSNLYDALANSAYPCLGSIGTSSLDMLDNNDGSVEFATHRWGEYWVARTNDGMPNVHYWKRWWSVRNMVEEFGYDNCSRMVQRDWDEGKYNGVYSVVRAICNNREKVRGGIGPESMPWTAYWWEEHSPDKKRWLRVEGFHEFPTFVPAWSLGSGDAYGRGPGWEVLGTCKALQHRELRKATIVDLMAEPPTVRKGKLESVNLLPGGVTHVELADGAGVETLHTVDSQGLAATNQEIANYERQIDEGMYANLWLAALRDSETGGPRPTATEVQARKVEVFLMLGPLLQNLEKGLLKPLIMRLYAILDRNNRLPPLPEELSGVEFSVEFVSILHAAQRSAGASGLQAFVDDVLRVAQVNVEVLDKLNVDAIVDQFATMYGVSPEVVRSSKEVEQLRAARAQAQQVKEEGEAMLAATQGAKNMAALDPNRMGQLMESMSPIAAAQTNPIPQ